MTPPFNRCSDSSVLPLFSQHATTVQFIFQLITRVKCSLQEPNVHYKAKCIVQVIPRNEFNFVRYII